MYRVNSLASSIRVATESKMDRVDEAAIWVLALRDPNRVANGASNLGAFPVLLPLSPAKPSSHRTENINCTTWAKQLTTPIANTKSIAPLRYIFDANTGQTLGAAITTPKAVKPATSNKEIICRIGWENCESEFKLL